MNLKVKIKDKFFDVEINDIYSRPILAKVDGTEIEVWPEDNEPSLLEIPQSSIHRTYPVQQPVTVATGEVEKSAGENNQIKAPIPGVITEIKVNAGETVTYGQDLCVLEAMKMKNAIRAGKAGIIEKINISVGDHVGQAQVLMEYRSEA